MKRIETDILNHKYFLESDIEEFLYDTSFEWNIVKVYPSILLQTWYGMGGSITESSAFNIMKLSKENLEKLLDAYYGSNGLDYNLGRISIGSNDFCLDSYSLTTKQDLSDFNLERDKKYILPVLKEILKKKNLSILASPWSPPAFMKDNSSLVSGGHLLKEYYKTYAKYLVKFIKEYQKEGIKIDFITMQNEPFAKQTWESCNFSLEEQKDFITNYLLEELEAVDTSIFLWDHNKENLVNVASVLACNHPKIKGIAFHSYMGTHLTNVSLTHQKYPNMLLFHTEGCTGYSKYNETEWLVDAELYLIDIMTDITGGLNGYIDWNILLDSHGGPNHKENYCKSPIILNEKEDGFILTPIYYYLLHIAKYIKKGFTFVPVDVYRPDLFSVSAVKDETVVTVLLNPNHYEIEVNLVINDKRIHDKLNPHTIVTYIYDSMNTL